MFLVIIMLGPTVDFADYIINKLRVKNRFYWVFTSSLVLYRIENQRNKIDSFVLTNILGFFICFGFFFVCLFIQFQFGCDYIMLLDLVLSCLVVAAMQNLYLYAIFICIKYAFAILFLYFFFSVYKAIGYVTLYVAVCLL